MQSCYCGLVEEGRGAAPFTCSRRSMVYIALCWYSSVLFSKNVRLFLFLYKYYIHIYIYIKHIIYRENIICLCDDKKRILAETNKCVVVWHVRVLASWWGENTEKPVPVADCRDLIGKRQVIYLISERFCHVQGCWLMLGGGVAISGLF